jgi:hypothetical protein
MLLVERLVEHHGHQRGGIERYFRSLPREPERIPPIIIHTIAPIMSTHGSANRRKPAFATERERMITSARSATQPHIMFIECFMRWTVRRALATAIGTPPQTLDG